MGWREYRKRVTVVVFTDLNDGVSNDERPDVVEAVFAVAACEVVETRLANWLRKKGVAF